MSLPAPEVVAAVLLAGAAGGLVIVALVAANRLLGAIASRLGTLQQVLETTSTATEPLTEHVTAVATNVAKLREAATAFNALARRIEDDRRQQAEIGTP